MAALFALPMPKVTEEKDEVENFVDINKNPGLEPTPLDMEIAKYLRFKVPRKSTMMQKQQVEYFIGSKAVDFLMDSKWATRKKGHDQLFIIREDATKYLNELLQKKFFYRVMKTEKESKKKGKKEEEEKESDKNQSLNEKEESKETSDTKLRKRKVKKAVDMEEEKNEDSETNKKKGKTKNNEKSKEKKSKEKVKKRYKLSQHDEQVFFDSKDIYIWLYNPVSWKTVAMGVGVLLCVVAATLFPLWPPEVRTGVYYLSVTGGIFIGFIFAIAFARTILYGVIWLFTGGNHHLWILPNILADVGFFESFQPWYTYEYKGEKEDKEDEEEQDSDGDTKDDKSDVDEGRDSQEEADSQQKEDRQSQNSSEEESQTQ